MSDRQEIGEATVPVASVKGGGSVTRRPASRVLMKVGKARLAIRVDELLAELSDAVDLSAEINVESYYALEDLDACRYESLRARLERIQSKSLSINGNGTGCLEIGGGERLSERRAAVLPSVPAPQATPRKEDSDD